MLLLALGFSLSAQTMHSVLESGTWYKLALADGGVYRLAVSDLRAAGVPMSGIEDSKIRLFGRENKMLPERCADPRPDDLTEMAVSVNDINGNGLFDGDDYVVFYATGNVDGDLERNLYSDTTYCFLNFGLTEGKRMVEVDKTDVADAQGVITCFDDFVYHDKDLVNVIASGRLWYGESFTDSLLLPVQLEGLVEGEPIDFELDIMGRCSQSFNVDVYYGTDTLFRNVTIASYTSVSYGSEVQRIKSFVPSSASSNLKITVNSTIAANVFLEKFVIKYPRRLSYSGGQLDLSLHLENTGQKTSANISGATGNMRILDITDPLEPSLVIYDNINNEAVFSVEAGQTRGFVAYETSNLKTVSSIRPVGNQNLHGTAYADMIVFTPAKYRSYADEIADFHRANDAMTVVVVTVEEVYNEFAAGNADLTAMRDFVRMVYQRSNENLKYVLLFGKASYDVRNILGRGADFIPTYETVEYPCNEVSSYCSDDYFGMMDDDDGPECLGKIDIAVGRIPVKNEDDAVIAVNKIKNYADITKNNGSWRARQLFVADVGDTYHTNSEISANLLENTTKDVEMQKTFFGAFPIVNVASGQRIPAATADLVNRLEKGTLVMFYSGHGGVTGLSKRSVFTTSDISHLQNGAMQPFVYTATCEFSKFDDPELISAGEQMLLRDDGGAIAMLTTTRSTYATNTVKLSKSIAPLLGAYDDDGKPYRFGDLVRLAKTNPSLFSYVNRGFVLFGDPALRIALPSGKIRVEDQSTSQLEVVYKGQEVEKQCYITDVNGNIDTLFNGVAEIRFFPGKTTLTTLADSQRQFSFYNDVVYCGTATVIDGRFTMRFVLPNDVDYDKYTLPRASFYAYDSVRGVDAAGAWHHIQVDDSQSTIVDNEGPEIEMFWNTADFSSGDTVVPTGNLYVKLSDESGIYHYDYLIGRDIVLNTSFAQMDNSILNSDFQPAIDDYRSGTLTIPIENLPYGTHTFTIKAWDLSDNSSTKTIELNVIDNILYKVSNYPNPFSDKTNFVLSSSLLDGAKVLIEIYNTMGQKVVQLESEANFGASIEWNGTNFAGAKLGAGVYPYRVTITDGDGARRSVMQKLVITQ